MCMSLPSKEHIKGAKNEGSFHVVSNAFGGEYLKKPAGATGLIDTSGDDQKLPGLGNSHLRVSCNIRLHPGRS